MSLEKRLTTLPTFHYYLNFSICKVNYLTSLKFKNLDYFTL